VLPETNNNGGFGMEEFLEVVQTDEDYVVERVLDDPHHK
jgi:hypothetical protein